MITTEHCVSARPAWRGSNPAHTIAISRLQSVSGTRGFRGVKQTFKQRLDILNSVSRLELIEVNCVELHSAVRQIRYSMIFTSSLPADQMLGCSSGTGSFTVLGNAPACNQTHLVTRLPRAAVRHSRTGVTWPRIRRYTRTPAWSAGPGAGRGAGRGRGGVISVVPPPPSVARQV